MRRTARRLPRQIPPPASTRSRSNRSISGSRTILGKNDGVKPKYFATPGDFRAWLDKHHDSETELWVGFHRKGSGKPSITWPESVDQALCFGWIDGVRKTVDENRYMIRFT